MEIIQNAFIQYHDPNTELPFPLLENTNSFGIIQVNINPSTVVKLPHQHLVFTIDKSGSMNYVCKDNKTKIDHIIFTLENMIRLFSQVNSCPISIHVNTFDDNAETCVKTVTVTVENAKEISGKIKKIRPKSSTNIEKALKYSNKHIEDYITQHPEHEITHIFLTDGVPTTGSIVTSYLKSLVSEKYANIFIGYGADHDAYLMTELSSNKKGSYLFIDALEKASFIYGEIIHNLLNKVAEVTIHCVNCEVYNYITNEWCSELYVGSLSKGNEKIYQVRSSDPNNSSFSISFNNNTFSYYPIKDFTNCTKYAFRQRTQELLYQVKCDIFNKREMCYTSNTENKLKEEIHSFLNLLMGYIKTNQLEEDKFLKMLCDDLYISHNTLGTEYAGIYTCARQTSQGRQTTYNVSLNEFYSCEIPELHNLSRNTAFYTLSDNLDSPYATQDILDTMRNISYRDEDS